jgi:DNA-binding LytR/AlgR family response regulator
MKVIIIEDEKLSAEHLELLLKKIDASIEVVATIDSVKKGLKVLSNGVKADLFFVDVHLADGLSFEIFSKIQIDVPVVFTTAYNEYAIRAFTLNSVDYLLKPVTIDDLKGALLKYNKLSKIYKTNILDNLNTVYQQAIKQYKNRFIVKMGDSIASIKTDDIMHFICEDRVVLLSTTNGKRYAVDYTLDNLESLIMPDLFFRINRNVIIHINSIEKVSTYFNNRLKVNTPELLEDDRIVSRERVIDFKKWLDR